MPPQHHHHHHPHPRPSKMNPTKDEVRSIDSFPERITYVLSALKIACGCFLIVLGTLALYQKASYSRASAGIWGGIMVVISGVIGIFTVRMKSSRISYVLIFLVACILAIIADVLVIIYSATGLAKDSGYPGGFVQDELTGELIPVSQVNIPAREKAMLVNLLLIIAGVLEVLLTLPSAIICLREICQCYSPELLLPDQRHNDWLMSWIGNQHNPVFYSSASGMPFNKIPPPHMMMSRATPPFVLLPSEHSSAGPPLPSPIYQSPRESGRRKSNPPPPHNINHYQRARSPKPSSRSSGRASKNLPNLIPAPYPPLEIYPPHFYYSPGPVPPPYPSPGSNLSHPSMAQLIPVFSSPEDFFDSPYQPQFYSPRHRSNRPHQHSSRKRSRSKSGQDRNRKKKSKAPSGLSDSDLDKTYTGLDRELAEEFIEQTMDPAIVVAQPDHAKLLVSSSNAQSPMSGTEGSEAW